MQQESEILLVPIERTIDAGRLIWGEDGAGLVQIRGALDLRGVPPWQALQTLRVEETLLARADALLAARATARGSESGAAAPQEAVLDALQEEAWDLDDFLGETQLNLGVGAAVAALSAIGCLPVMSCRGGPDHQELYPLVIFRALPAHLPRLLAAAEQAGCGLTNQGEGLELYAHDVRHLVACARALLAAE